MEELDFVQDESGYCYFKKGTKILHREDGPAYCKTSFILDFTITRWYINGLLHREDGPAVIYSDGSYSCWYFNNNKHRAGGPAEQLNITSWWWVHGKLHRVDGPAIEATDGFDNQWWIDDNRLSPEKETILNKWWENKTNRAIENGRT